MTHVLSLPIRQIIGYSSTIAAIALENSINQFFFQHLE